MDKSGGRGVEKKPPEETSGSAETQQPLPPGWSEAIAPEGKAYYRNHADNTTSWDRPVLAQADNNALIKAAAVAAASGPKPRQRERACLPPLRPRRASVGKCVNIAL
ncbi:conserved unknown protein [Ectocarpus siliculosus]|uniref:WW domain-containing protein n=1 Tax=Ectocarpus siliculosus TaxID=2880 RepID=D8LMG9_ECTSI|nr:conserved unknown protein [Ectocarpus siliculosus]|eukprot:CBN77579.1 conserved unknown protein [Ectocarpus siliculosus]